jgi:hypothetical protein
LRYHVKAAA